MTKVFTRLFLLLPLILVVQYLDLLPTFSETLQEPIHTIVMTAAYILFLISGTKILSAWRDLFKAVPEAAPLPRRSKKENIEFIQRWYPEYTP